MNFYKSAEVLNKIYYDGDSKLKTRIDFWNRFGLSSISYSKFLKDIIDRDTYDSMIDLGCGNAFYSAKLLPKIKKEALFIDVSNKILEQAKINVVKSPFLCNVCFACDDISKNSFQIEKKYDLILAMHVLQHIKDIMNCLEKIKLIASKDSQIIITTYDKTLTDWINQKHYALLRKLKFPQYMFEKEEYLRFSGRNASALIRECFPNSNIMEFEFRNSANCYDSNALLDYYSSAMMFRMSKGIESSDISKNQWHTLYCEMKKEIKDELKKSKIISVEGNVKAFKITSL